MNQKINLLTVLVLAASVSGCEVIAAIDRNVIPGASDQERIRG